MSEANVAPEPVELMRLAVAAFNRGDFGLYASPDIVLDTARYGMGTFIGREAAIGFLKEWVGSFEDLTMEPDEILDLGNGVVLIVVHQVGRPLGGSENVRVHSAYVFEWVDGMVARATFYTDTDIDEAHADAERLAEEPT